MEQMTWSVTDNGILVSEYDGYMLQVSAGYMGWGWTIAKDDRLVGYATQFGSASEAQYDGAQYLGHVISRNKEV